MRALFEDIPSRKGGASFVAYHRIVPHFPFKWHYHPEYELTLITQGKGKRLVGDNHDNFTHGDLVLIGPNLPHTWVSDEIRTNPSGAVVIQFSQEFIAPFLNLPEFHAVSNLLTAAANGLHFPTTMQRLIQAVKALPENDPVQRVTSLLEILQLLSKADRVKLASLYFNAVRGEENEHRINTVCEHIQHNFKNRLSLEETAGLIGLSNTAFCKFFKRVTGKTFSQYVNEVRIGNACSLLTDTDKPIADIAFACGFESLTYFNRVFMKMKQMTPRNFRNQATNYNPAS